jgi:hypothetical protein
VLDVGSYWKMAALSVKEKALGSDAAGAVAAVAAGGYAYTEIPERTRPAVSVGQLAPGVPTKASTHCEEALTSPILKKLLAATAACELPESNSKSARSARAEGATRSTRSASANGRDGARRPVGDAPQSSILLYLIAMSCGV